MFENVTPNPEWYMTHIDERVQPRHQSAVVQRAHEQIAADPNISDENFTATSLLLGQYVEVVYGKELPGKPLTSTELGKVGLDMRPGQIEEVVSHINQAVLTATTIADTIPAERPGRYVGEKDYNEKNPTSVYLEKLQDYPRLSHEQHRGLSIIIQAGQKAKHELDLLGADTSEAGIQDRLQDDIDRGSQAHEALVCANLRFAAFMAKRYQGIGLPFDDLVQEANIALMDAAEKWRVDFDTTFTTYAGVAIKRKIMRAVHDQASTIRVPDHMHLIVDKYRDRINEFKEQNGTMPTEDYMSLVFGYDHSTLNGIRLAMRALRPTEELDERPMRPAVEEYDGEDHGVHPKKQKSDDENAFSFEDEVIMTKYMPNALYKALSTLDERQEGILRLRFGMVDGEPKSLAEIAQIYGVTRERIRQVETQAIKKLRHPDRSHRLRGYLD